MPVAMDMETEEHQDVEFSANATTIDPSVISSRIRQSASLQKAEQMIEDPQSGASEQPHFPKLSAVEASGNKVEYRRVRCPPHRYTPLREYWEQILTPLVEYLNLQVRYNRLLCIYTVCQGQRKKLPNSAPRISCCSWNFKPIESRKPRFSTTSWGGNLCRCLMPNAK